jgi:hypothetical protein
MIRRNSGLGGTVSRPRSLGMAAVVARRRRRSGRTVVPDRSPLGFHRNNMTGIRCVSEGYVEPTSKKLTMFGCPPPVGGIRAHCSWQVCAECRSQGVLMAASRDDMKPCNGNDKGVPLGVHRRRHLGDT